MTSEKQIQANKKNSQLGGVKTEEGKLAVRYNALKHGILSQELFVEKNNKNDFKEFEEALLKEFKPDSALEDFLVDRIITCAWRLKTVVKIEKNIILMEKNNEDAFALGTGEQLKRKLMANIVGSEYLEKMNRYETSLENKFYRAIREFRKVKNGFVSQNEE